VEEASLPGLRRLKWPDGVQGGDFADLEGASGRLPLALTGLDLYAKSRGRCLPGLCLLLEWFVARRDIVGSGPRPAKAGRHTKTPLQTESGRADGGRKAQTAMDLFGQIGFQHPPG